MEKGLVVIGRVTRSHGIRGELRVFPYSDSNESLHRYEKLFFRTSDEEVELLKVENVRPHKKNLVLLKLNGIYTLDSAERFIGADILIKREWMPPLEPDEYYLSDLIGMTVVDEDGRNIGKVTDLLSTEADDLLIITGETNETMLPFREEMVKGVDLESGQITASIPPGLEDL